MKTFVIAPHFSMTEIAVFEGKNLLLHETVRHTPAEIHSRRTPAEQGRFRSDAVMDALSSAGYDIKNVDAIIAEMESRSLPPGVYMVDGELLKMLSDDVIEENQLRSGVFTVHFLSCYISERFDKECMPLIVEPVIENEITMDASLSGIKGIMRDPQYKSLSQRAGIAFYAWYAMRLDTNDITGIAVHLGKHISVGAFDRGRMIDNNSVQDGEGPLSPSSCGCLPMDALIDLCYSGKYDMDEMLTIISQESGLSSYLDNASLEYVSQQYRAGNEKIVFLVRAMALSVAREIGAKAAALRGHVDIIVMVGPWAEFDEFVELIKPCVEWISPVIAFAYESELVTLALCAEKAYAGGCKILLYGRDRQ